MRPLPQCHVDPTQQDARRRDARSGLPVLPEHAVSEPRESPRSDTGASARPEFAVDGEKRASLVALRDRYIEARNSVPAGSPHANLDWILGARRSPTQDPLAFEPSTIRLVALWLQDLATDLESRLDSPITEKPERGPGQVDAARRSMATRLREATKRFQSAFRRSA